MRYKKIGCTAKDNKEAINAKMALIHKYNFLDLDTNYNNDIDLIIMFGGDGFALHTIHRFIDINVPFYGMNYGTVGFLMNEQNSSDDILAKLEDAEEITINPLRISAFSRDNKEHQSFAINEISFLREGNQAAKINLSIDNIERLSKMTADGILISTPAGSTAYNFSVHGPILPFTSNLLAITPISPFRPRHWRGALINNDSVMQLEVLEPEKRPVGVTADFILFKDIIYAQIFYDKTKQIRFLFNKSLPIKEKIIREQFFA